MLLLHNVLSQNHQSVFSRVEVRWLGTMTRLWPDNPLTHLRRWVVLAEFNCLFCSDLSSGRAVSQGVACPTAPRRLILTNSHTFIQKIRAGASTSDWNESSLLILVMSCRTTQPRTLPVVSGGRSTQTKSLSESSDIKTYSSKSTKAFDL